MNKRRLVKVVKMRLMDAQVGDIVHRDASADLGWFVVADKSTMFNGDIQLADETTYITISGGDYDTIGVQIVTDVELPSQPQPKLTPAMEDSH